VDILGQFEAQWRILRDESHLLEEQIRPPFASGGVWLVRPDGYVALTTGQDGWDVIAAYLDRIGRR